MNENKITINAFTSGHCTGNNRLIHKGGNPGKLIFKACWALIVHPDLGSILFDTGYSTRFFECTRSFPEVLFRRITPVTIPEKDQCLNILNDQNINAGDIDHIVISHFHADHVGGLKDFPSAKLWCNKMGLDLVDRKGRMGRLSKGILKDLIPADIQDRVSFPENLFKEETIGGLKCWKWNEDIWFIDLPGHARGQIGLLIKNSNKGDILLVGDASWTAHAFKEKVYPSRTAAFISDSYENWCKTIDLLHNYHTADPGTVILPSHCEESFKQFQAT